MMQKKAKAKAKATATRAGQTQRTQKSTPEVKEQSCDVDKCLGRDVDLPFGGK